MSDARDGGVLAWEPSAEGPSRGVALGGWAVRERNRDREWQMRGESRHPVVLLVDLRGGRLDARHPHRHVLAETVDRVIGAGGVDRLDWGTCPIPKLGGLEVADQRRVGSDLCGMPFFGPHAWVPVRIGNFN